MHCWKTINVKKQYGFDRLFLLSSLLVMIVFSFAYVLLGIFNDSAKSDKYFSLFVLSFLCVYPLHKFFHYLAIFGHTNKLKFIMYKQFGFLPIFSLRISEPIKKNRFVFVLISPFLFINLSLLSAAILVPAFSHYFTILLAYHCGMCLIDLIYVKNLMKSPKTALIEETATGFEILIAPIS